ncbi:MAG TPA: aminopeptidase N, partial [Pseudomonadota bacterium]|nr:aminopeptidase N [Pseudomonadota bacterium]
WRMKNLAFGGVLAAVLALASLPLAAGAASLTQAEAELRARQLAQIAYKIELTLDPAQEEFTGTTTVSFDLQPGADGRGLFVELAGAKIQALQLNGAAQTPAQVSARYDGQRIGLSPAELRPRGNRLVVSYTRAYVRNGNGLHRVKDASDGRLYHFNHFEAYYAHLVFPCFDQPDLKAPIELTVEAPKDWEVISSTPAAAPVERGGNRLWRFPRTPAISTYVLTLAAGPFKIWSGQAGRTPLRLLTRHSVSQYIEPEEWLTPARQSLAFFEKEFSLPYPYQKLDLIVVPDFPAGATENLAGITIGERSTVFRSKQPPAAYVQRAAIITHEIAHMWFGDLVTMKWWNGLWLNESFASLMETLALAEATRYRQDAWPHFFSGEKSWAYREDQLVTTHPIELAVADTDAARSIFDGITYGKGASVLKQLRYYLGADKFRAGLKTYFAKYAYKNTVIEDFMGALGQAAGVELGPWQKLWLQSAGLNTVGARWECKDGKLARLALVQSAPAEHPVLRPHRTELGFYARRAGALRLESTVTAAYAGATTEVPAALGRPCPELVFPNQNDHDYVKVELDPVSLATMQESLGRLEDRLTRQMMWGTLYGMLRDAKISPAAYLETVFKQLAGEADPQILSDVLRPLGREVVRYIAPARRAALRGRLETFMKAQLDGAEAGSDRQLLYYKGYLAAAITPAAEGFLQALLRGGSTIPGLPLNQDRRWGIIQALARLGAANARELIAAELARDSTDEGRKGGFNAEAQLPDGAVKNKWFRRITRSSPEATENKLAAGDLREAMELFAVPGQEPLLQSFVDPYFSELVALAGKGEDNMYLQRMSEVMYPADCAPALIEKTAAFLKAHPELPAGVVKSLRVRQQEVGICLKLQAL